MTNDLVSQALRKAVAGDTAALSTLRAVPHGEALIASMPRPLVLSATAVGSVISAYRDGAISRDEAQRWASFISRGYLTVEDSHPIAPIDIEWEATHELSIAEALMRLDELGDQVDGDLRPGEAEQLIAALGRPDPV